MLSRHLRWTLTAVFLCLNGALGQSQDQGRSLAYNAMMCGTNMGIPILKFIVAYYIAHAFTIRVKPGFGPFYTVLYSLLALFFPYFGLILAARSMEEFAIFEDNPLDTALKAGGLCTLARTYKWKPEMDDDEILYCDVKAPDNDGSSEIKESSPDGLNTASNPNPVDNIADATLSQPAVNALNQETNFTEITIQPKPNDEISESPSEENFGCQIYCEEGLEILHQRYIRIHGLCFLPRGNCIARPGEDRCTNCHRTLNGNPLAEEEGNSVEPLKCQAGQYMMVRLPPNCQVEWKKHQDAKFHFRGSPNHRKYYSRFSSFEKLIRKMFHSKKPEAGAKTGRWISQHDASISASYSIVKSFVALFQLYAIIDFLIKEKSNDRINISYASYQLTVIPYGLMSLLNILCGFLTPAYPAVYMVRNTVMDEAIKRGGVFDGIVGVLIEEQIDESKMPIIKFNRPAKSNNPPPPGSPSQTTPVSQNNSAAARTVFIRHEDLQIDDGALRPLVVGWFVYLWGVIPLLRLISYKKIRSAFSKLGKENTVQCSETSVENNPQIDAEKTNVTFLQPLL
ncbi:hypothetical protein FPQ18DRAFT_74871 [Pyronema domesticum]|nr:hypothetical protein FPQ18DRAFT_74871 [Pyronema domesticum]